MSAETNTQAAIDAGLLIAKPINLEPDASASRLQAVIVPEGCELESLENLLAPHRDFPPRIIACPKFETLDSLLEYVTGFKNEDSKVFVTAPPLQPPTVLAILDYHNPESASWASHKAIYVSRFSVEWNRWTSFDRKKLTQAEFATLLEENASLIVDPPGAELLELVTTLEGHADIACNQMIRLPNGRAKLLYDENVSLTGQVSSKPGAIEFPTALKVQLQPFDGGPAYTIPCRLRYRIENRRINFWFECVDLHLVIKECVEAMIDRIQEKLELTPLMGSPA
jgi:uncharacterized protein YfdQ (DUF2303 family)